MIKLSAEMEQRIGFPERDRALMGDAAPGEYLVNDVDTPVPVDLHEPHPYRMFVMPVRLRKKTRGGIHIPDELIDAQLWNQQIGKVARMGSACFRGGKWRDMGIEEPPFKVGAIIQINPRSPIRFEFRGVTYIVLNDDQYIGHMPDVGMLEHFKFLGLEG